MAEDTGFLGRWSRRKLTAKEGKPLEAEPVAVPTPSVTAKAPVAVGSAGLAEYKGKDPAANPGPRPQDEPAPPPPLPTLQDAQALTPQSDFKPFMAQGVAPEVKNAAMKKLFADPQFNVMDGLDTYIDDYSKPDPLPASMLRQMASAKFLKMFDDEEEEEEKKAAQAKAAAQNLEEPRDDADTPAGQAVAQSDLCKQLPSQPESPALPASQPLDAHTDLRLQPDHAPAGREPGQGAG